VGNEFVVRFRASPELEGVVQRPRRLVQGPYSSATGVVFQAFWTAEERLAFRRAYPLAEYGRGLWPDEAALEEFLAEVRRVGAAQMPPGPEGMARAAVPVFASTGELVAGAGAARVLAEGEDTDAALDGMTAGLRRAVESTLPASDGAATRRDDEGSKR
jgi:DNA-binding IclR family transcriptional regulator